MSSLKVAAIESFTENTPPVIKDSNGVEIGAFCRAWVNFNGTGTVAIRDEFNVSGIVDNGTGDYSVVFRAPMPTNSYARSFSVNDNTNNAVNVATIYDAGFGGTDPTVDGFRFCTINSGATGILDLTQVTVAVFV